MALSILFKSIGLDKYEETAVGGGGWEDVFLKIDQKGKRRKRKNSDDVEYEVIQPVIPESIRIAKEKEKQEGRSLYE